MNQKICLSNLPNLEDIRMEKAFRRLRDFIPYVWSAVMPEGVEYIPGWHIDVMCEHLEAISRGEIKKIIINIPPRHMKSLLVSVFWPAWEWLHNPAWAYLTTSYSEGLSLRDSVRMRTLILSDEYLRLKDYLSRTRPSTFLDFELKKGEGEKQSWSNNRGGERLATSVMGRLTGMGGDRIIVDDPHNVVEGESKTVRDNVITWFDEALSSRVNNAKTGAFVIIMQRIHEQDLVGHLMRRSELEKDDPSSQWEFLCLPGFYECENRSKTSLNFVDPRTRENEPLWEARFNEIELKNMVRGAYARAGQIQQRPSPREGGFFDFSEPGGGFKVVKNIDQLPYPLIDKVRYWDKASTEGSGAYTSGVLMGLMKNNQVVVLDVIRGQWGKPRREKIIRQTAVEDGHEVDTWVEQEPGGGGKESAEDTVRNLAGYNVFKDRVTGDKITRAEPYALQVMEGNVFVLERHWTKGFIEEHQTFPAGRFKDMVDSSSGCYNKITSRITLSGGW